MFISSVNLYENSTIQVLLVHFIVEGCLLKSMRKIIGSGARLLGFISGLFHQLAVWGLDFSYLSLSLLFCKMGISGVANFMGDGVDSLRYRMVLCTW